MAVANSKAYVTLTTTHSHFTDLKQRNAFRLQTFAKCSIVTMTLESLDTRSIAPPIPFTILPCQSINQSRQSITILSTLDSCFKGSSSLKITTRFLQTTKMIITLDHWPAWFSRRNLMPLRRHTSARLRLFRICCGIRVRKPTFNKSNYLFRP